MKSDIDKMFEIIEDFANEPEKKEKIIPNLNDAPRRKRGRPKKVITKDELNAEKVLVGKIIRLMCVGFQRPEIARALNIDEQTIKTLRRNYMVEDFVKANKLDISIRLNSTIEAFLFGTVNNRQILEVEHKKDMELEDVIEGLCAMAGNKAEDATQRIQAYKAIAEIKGLKLKPLPEGELLRLSFEDIYEPEEVKEENIENISVKSNNKSKEFTMEFIVDEPDLFKDIV